MIDSSYIKSLSYNPRFRALTVEFSDGAIIRYESVHPRTVSAATNAKESVGEKFTELIRDKHNFVILRKAAA